MKFPKNRANIYVVTRELVDNHTAVLGVFSDAVDADDFCGACAAEWFELTKGLPATFEVRLSTYYG